MAIRVNLDLLLDAICKALDCQPGDLLEYVPDEEGQVEGEGT